MGVYINDWVSFFVSLFLDVNPAVINLVGTFAHFLHKFETIGLPKKKQGKKGGKYKEK